MDKNTRILLDPEDFPREYLNILPSLDRPLDPPLDPRTEEPIAPEALTALFPEECVKQEVSDKKRISIPQEVRDILIRSGRPTPVQRAVGLERALHTPCQIYFKREDVSPTGAHKLNTAVAQAYYASKEGVERLATETGAGQWGSAVALACSYFGISAMIYMVRVSYEQKAHRGTLMEMYGGEIVPSPSDRTEFGRNLKAQHPDHPGTLGIAISEALEDTMSNEGTKYTLGSVLNFVLIHQSVIGLEVDQQLRSIDVTPDIAIGCVGGGSNFAGMVYPLIVDTRYSNTRFVAVEPRACPTLTRGEYRYDFGDTAGLTPKLKMYTLGADFTPPRIHAGGLRYHGVAPTISALVSQGTVEAIAYEQVEVLQAGRLFAQTEGIVPAPESAHAIKAAIDFAVEAKRTGEPKSIIFNLSGHGHFDMSAYRSLLLGELGPAAKSASTAEAATPLK